MNTTEDQIKQLEEEIRKTPYHKGTERHIGVLRARIANLKDKQLEVASRKSGGGGGYAVKKQGEATVVLVGPPSAGKSTLLNALTNAESKVAPYAFTTVSVIPGMMKYRNAYIQILDVPGLIEGAEEGKGRGREVISVVRGADLLLIMSDPKRVEAIDRMKEALERNGIRVNQVPPRVRVDRRLNGGLTIQTNIKQDLEKDTMKEILSQMGVKNADVYIEEKITMQQLIDALAKNRVYVPALQIINKADTAEAKALQKKVDQLDGEYLFISADKEAGLSDLQEIIWKKLGFATIFLIKPLEEPGEKNPMVVRTNMTLKDVGNDIGSEFMEGKTRAKIWGNGAKFPGQEVSLEAHVKEGMQVRFL